MNRRRPTNLVIVLVCLVVGLGAGVPGLYAQAAKSPVSAAPQSAGAKAPEASKPASPATPVPAAEQPALSLAGKPGKEAPQKYNVEDFAFSQESYRDPFAPVLLLKAKTARGANVKASTGKGSTAKAEKIDKIDYALEELRLVGIIKSGTGMIAMMEDSQGKGVFFRKGDYLNKNLWVMDVAASSVLLGYKAKGEIKKIAVDIPTKN